MSSSKPCKKVNVMQSMGLNHVSGVPDAKKNKDKPVAEDAPLSPADNAVSFDTLNDEQLAVVKLSLELMARLSMCQMETLTDLAQKGVIPIAEDIPKSLRGASITCFGQIMDEARANMGFENCAEMSIFSDSVAREGKVAWDLFQTMENPGADSEKAS